MSIKIYFTPTLWSISDWQTKTFRKGFKFWGLYLRWRIFNYFPDVDGLKGHCSSVQFTLYGHNLKRLALSTEFSESICILWRVYGGSCVPLCLKLDGTWVGTVGYVCAPSDFGSHRIQAFSFKWPLISVCPPTFLDLPTALCPCFFWTTLYLVPKSRFSSFFFTNSSSFVIILVTMSPHKTTQSSNGNTDTDCINDKLDCA